jgi:hypothetical protein
MERAEAVLFPLVRRNRVIGVVCLNHRMLHDEGSSSSSSDFGEWVQEPVAALAKGRGLNINSADGPMPQSKSTNAADVRREQQRVHAAQDSIASLRMRAVLSFVSGHLGMTLAQSTTLSALLITVVDVFSSYFPIASLKVSRRRALRAGATGGAGAYSSGAETSDSEGEGDSSRGGNNSHASAERLRESKRETVAKAQAALDSQREFLEAQVLEVAAERASLHEQVLLEQAHSRRAEERCKHMQADLAKVNVHIAEVAMERDALKREMRDMQEEREDACREKDGQIQHLMQQLQRQKELCDDKDAALAAAQLQIEASKLVEVQVQTQHHHMHKLHGVLKAANRALHSDDEGDDDDDDDENRDNAGGGGVWSTFSGEESDDSTDELHRMLM